jgi:chromosome segregation ATPase
LFSRKKNDRMEYEQKDVHNNFVIESRDGEVRATMVVLAANPSSSRSADAIFDCDSMGLAIRLDKGEDLRYGIKRMRAANRSGTLDIALWWSKLEIQNARNSNESNTELIKLQQEILANTTKYELLEQEIIESIKGQKKLEQDQGEWILEKIGLINEFEVLRRSKEQLQKLRSNDQKKLSELVQEIANVTTQLTVWNEAVKGVQSALQVQKEQNEKFMSFVDAETNKVDIRRVL